MKRITLSAKDRALLYRALMLAAAVWVLGLLQTSFLPHFSFFGTVPDLVLALVVVTARETDEKFGGTVGLIGGILIFMLGDVGVALWILFYAAIGFLAGAFAKLVLGKNYPSYLVFAATACLLKLIYSFLLCLLLSADAQPFRALWQSFLPEAIITFVCAALLYVPLGAFVRRTRRKEAV